MTHPDNLTDYVLDELGPAEARAVELHLARCAACRAELRTLKGTVVAMVETVPGVVPPQTAWQGVQTRLAAEKSVHVPAPARRRAWQPFAVAASLLIALGGLFWGYQEQQSYQQLAAEQRKVAGWLSRPDVVTQQLTDPAGERLGSVLTLADGRALFVLRAAPPTGSRYQAWGYGAETGVVPVDLGSTGRTLLEVPYTDYAALELSLEPEQGSLQPTQPLGRVAVPAGSS